MQRLEETCASELTSEEVSILFLIPILFFSRRGESRVSDGSDGHRARSSDAVGTTSMKGIVGWTINPSELTCFGIAPFERFRIGARDCVAAFAFGRRGGGGALECSHPNVSLCHVCSCSCVHSLVYTFLVPTCVHCHAPTHVSKGERDTVGLPRWLK